MVKVKKMQVNNRPCFSCVNVQCELVYVCAVSGMLTGLKIYQGQ